MRALSIGLLTALLGVAVATAGEQTLKTKAEGNCGSCKKRITKAVKSVDGVQDVTWDKSTKDLTVKYDDDKTTPDAIKKAVVTAGHDVESQKADDKVYNDLPDCCKYRDGGNEH